MNVQRLRNLTTGILHTDIKYVYEDLEMIIGDCGLMTHMIPRVMRAVEPWLREQVIDPRFWDGAYDPTHVGEFDLPIPSDADRKAMFERYILQPDPLAGKEVIKVIV